AALPRAARRRGERARAERRPPAAQRARLRRRPGEAGGGREAQRRKERRKERREAARREGAGPAVTRRAPRARVSSADEARARASAAARLVHFARRTKRTSSSAWNPSATGFPPASSNAASPP